MLLQVKETQRDEIRELKRERRRGRDVIEAYQRALRAANPKLLERFLAGEVGEDGDELSHVVESAEAQAGAFEGKSPESSAAPSLSSSKRRAFSEAKAAGTSSQGSVLGDAGVEGGDGEGGVGEGGVGEDDSGDVGGGGGGDDGSGGGTAAIAAAAAAAAPSSSFSSSSSSQTPPPGYVSPQKIEGGWQQYDKTLEKGRESTTTASSSSSSSSSSGIGSQGNNEIVLDDNDDDDSASNETEQDAAKQRLRERQEMMRDRRKRRLREEEERKRKAEQEVTAETGVGSGTGGVALTTVRGRGFDTSGRET